jgi:hypothetical protein
MRQPDHELQSIAMRRRFSGLSTDIAGQPKAETTEQSTKLVTCKRAVPAANAD